MVSRDTSPLPPSAEKSTSARASSIRRFWSSVSSALRVSFSVVSTVRSATSWRIRSRERRVSASMSRRAAASSSSRFSRPSSVACNVVASADLRARATISSACSRASLRRARYPARIWSASWRVFSAESIESRIALARLSRASWILGKATLLRTHIVNPNSARVQIIRPRAGETRKLPPEATMWTVDTNGLEEEGDQPEDEGVEGDRLGERETEPADRLKVVLHLRLAGDRLDFLAEDEADPDAGADRAEPGADAERDRLAGVGHASVGDAARGDGQWVNHNCSFLVGLGDRAADVDRREGGEDERLKRCDQANLKNEEQERDGE